MEWKKVPDAAVAWAGGVNAKVLYRAINEGKCKAARFGSGRNLLVCREFIDSWLLATVRDGHVEGPKAVCAPGPRGLVEGANARRVRPGTGNAMETDSDGDKPKPTEMLLPAQVARLDRTMA